MELSRLWNLWAQARLACCDGGGARCRPRSVACGCGHWNAGAAQPGWGAGLWPPQKRRAAVLTPDLRAWPYVEPGCRNVISLQEVVLEQGGPLTPREL